jgi:MoaA/NifB/PqqE/SkfB family radical SAM enzyme
VTDFPKFISFTVTNACNLSCKMCGQWGEEGTMRHVKKHPEFMMETGDWKRLVDEIADRGIGSILIRGGEPFLLPGIVDLLEHIHDRGLFTSIDTNGTLLKEYAADIVRLGNIHLTISIDGPEAVHDAVRRVNGSFNRIREGAGLLNELEKESGRQISKSICFTISPYSVTGLGGMPAVARSLSIPTLVIVPYYYVPLDAGKSHEEEMRTRFDCSARSWRGFRHDVSGVDFTEFQKEHKKYLADLGGIHDYPYMPFSDGEYRAWFGGFSDPVGPVDCSNVERLIDVQPGGDANFCVDFPDYSMGNVRESTIDEVWNGERARRFREYRRKEQLPVCGRCGAKYMSTTQ